MENDTGFATRLTRFWADHFTIVGRNPRLSALAATHTEEAIRPNLNGRFGDMLVAAVTHPAMLIYLDQISSAGNNSLANKRRKRGLNENLAREILELHTMGVGADYAQKDVRQLAELLSGLSVGKRGRIFRDAMAEPGAETVLGKTYGQDDGLANIEAALNDIAMHPQTAAHLAGKLVRHFVSDRPNREQVAYVAEAYLKSGGDLGRCYAALLEHPASWAELGGKVKQPFDYLASSLRALELDSRGSQERQAVAQTSEVAAHLGDDGSALLQGQWAGWMAGGGELLDHSGGHGGAD